MRDDQLRNVVNHGDLSCSRLHSLARETVLPVEQEKVKQLEGHLLPQILPTSGTHVFDDDGMVALCEAPNDVASAQRLPADQLRVRPEDSCVPTFEALRTATAVFPVLEEDVVLLHIAAIRHSVADKFEFASIVKSDIH